MTKEKVMKEFKVERGERGENEGIQAMIWRPKWDKTGSTGEVVMHP